MDSPIARSIQEFAPGKQVTLVQLIAYPTDDVDKTIGVPGAVGKSLQRVVEVLARELHYSPCPLTRT